MEPKFRRRGDGHASLFDTEEAKRIKRENRPWVRALSPERVKESAKMAVLRRGGDPENMQHVLGQHQMQFGIFRGQTFQWVAENALGYAGYVVASMSEESGNSDSHNNLVNKRAFQGYISHYPAGRYAIQVKREVRSARSQSQPATAAAATSTQPPSNSPRPSASSRATTATQPPSSSPRPSASSRAATTTQLPSTSPRPSASLRAATSTQPPSSSPRPSASSRAATTTQPPSSSPRPSASSRAATTTQPPSTSPRPSASLRAGHLHLKNHLRQPREPASCS
ncbi:uncharacterized protein LOC141754071 [Sebastes fasciatus]|uniref:uncharacterized protein LOC141754071 n=1 Tax=Sebastes fasciatus TaxID=394691 RepID=UPI003D9F82DE